MGIKKQEKIRDMETVTVRLPRNKFKKLERIAANDCRSMGSAARVLLEAALENAAA